MFGNPGLHMTHSMYGLILVEPKGGLPPVDKEFYVVQGEFYSERGLGWCLGRHPRGERNYDGHIESGNGH